MGKVGRAVYLRHEYVMLMDKQEGEVTNYSEKVMKRWREVYGTMTAYEREHYHNSIGDYHKSNVKGLTTRSP